MPLCQLVGITSVHTTFNMGFALTSGEAEEDFTWVLNAVNDVATQLDIRRPSVIISDFCQAFRNAASAVYPGIAQQLCIWHVNKNVAWNARKKWIGNGHNLWGPDREAVDQADIPRGPTIDADSSSQWLEFDDEASTKAWHCLSQFESAIHDDLDFDPSHPPPSAQTQPPSSAPAPQSTGSTTGSTSQRHWDDTYDGFMDAWTNLALATTEEVFDSRWKVLKNEFAGQSGT